MSNNNNINFNTGFNNIYYNFNNRSSYQNNLPAIQNQNNSQLSNLSPETILFFRQIVNDNPDFFNHQNYSPNPLTNLSFSNQAGFYNNQNNNHNLFNCNQPMNNLVNNQISFNNYPAFSNQISLNNSPLLNPLTTFNQQESLVNIQDVNRSHIEYMSPQPKFELKFNFSSIKKPRKKSFIISHQNKEINSLIKKIFVCIKNKSEILDFINDFSKYQPKMHYEEHLVFNHLFDFFKVYLGNEQKIKSAIKILEALAEKESNGDVIYYRLGCFNMSSHPYNQGSKATINFLAKAAFKGNFAVLDEMLDGFDLQKRLYFLDRLIDKFDLIYRSELNHRQILTFFNFILKSYITHAYEKECMNDDEKVTKFSHILKKSFEQLTLISEYENDEIKRLYNQSIHLLTHPIIHNHLTSYCLSYLAFCFYNNKQFEKNVNLSIELWVEAACKDEEYIEILKYLEKEERLIFQNLFEQKVHHQNNENALRSKLSTVLLSLKF
ncbi:MAG: hypothetical protein Q8K60_02520 [Parachlamydiaceae bacterium]|nr:hypothetical protein [Parachlamydiaceae bacterium]